MKRIGNLYEKIISIENLLLASKRAQKGKRSYRSVRSWNLKLNENINILHEELKSKSYKVSEYSIFTIFEPKERTISRLPFRDRVVHHAVLNYLEPILKSTFISQTYSCIKKRGIHRGLKDLSKALLNESESKFCLKFDIKKFYPSVDNSILKQKLRTKFKDDNLLQLLDTIIDSNKGLPLGNYTSQWLANFYLNKFDHWLKETKGIKYYFRYCDDVVILGVDKKLLHELRKEIEEFLFSNLKLELSNYQVFPVKQRGIDFLGYKCYHTHILLRKSIKQRFKRMTRVRPNEESMAAYWGWITHCNGFNLWNKYTKL